MTTTRRCRFPASSTRPCSARPGWLPSTPTTESTYEPIPPQSFHPARARPAPGRTGRQERRVQVVHRRSGLGVWLSPDAGDQREAAIAKRLDRLSRQTERLERDQNIQIETLALFIRYFLTVSTPVPEAHQDAARAQGKVRFEQFVEQLGRHLLRGRSLVRDVVEELHPDPMQMDDAAAMASAHERTAERAS